MPSQPYEERIDAAALLLGKLVITLPPPARHHHLLRAVAHVGYKEFDLNRNTYAQGFVTNYRRFVGRREAMLIARAAGQLIPREGGYMEGEINTGDELFSEDVW